MKKAGREKVTLENIGRFKNNNNFESTCCTWFHPDHIDPRISVAQETTSESSEIVFSWLVGNGDLVNKRRMEGSLSRAWYDMLRGICNKVMFPLLHRSIWFNMWIGNINWSSPEDQLVLVGGPLVPIRHFGRHTGELQPQGPVDRVSWSKETLHQIV